MLPGQTHQEYISSILSTPSTPSHEARQARQFFEAHQARHFMKHAKHVSTPSTRARQTRNQAKHTSTQARHLADSHYTETYFIFTIFVCPCLGLDLFMSYLFDLFFIFSLIFIVINDITSFKQTYLNISYHF